MAVHEKSGIAFVTENFGDEGGRAAATFTVHWEANEGDADKDGPEAVSVEEAIAWGREHAPIVLVRLLDENETEFSAGEVWAGEADDEEPLLEWPREGLVLRPRPIESPLDGSVQELSWPFKGELVASGITEDAKNSIEAQVRADERVDQFQLNATGGNGWEVQCALTAPGTRTAIIAADQLISTAVAKALPGSASPQDVNLELQSLKG